MLLFLPPIFILGLAVGSFLNVLISRLPKNEEIVRNRSHCPHCQHPLAWHDLIPLLSFILLKGNCRYCQKKISWQYPLVELSTGIIFALLFYKKFVSLDVLDFSLLTSHGLTELAEAFSLLIISCILITIFAIDLKHLIIPDKLVLIGTIISIINIILNHYDNLNSVILTFCGAISLSLFFYFLHLITKGRGMGGGDIKLVFLLGLIMGFPQMFVGIFISFLTGAIIGLLLILIGRKKFGQQIAFGPFLVFNTFVMIFFGNKIMDIIQLILFT